jgi:apolipoprotein D and lipocalin family protein
MAAAMLLSVGAAAGPPALAQSVPIAPLPRFDGIWYEVASFGTGWQRDCSSGTMFELAARTATEATLRGRCRTTSGVAMRSGLLRAEGDQGRWRSHFAPRGFGWLPGGWGDFWVLGHDPELSWFVVGTHSHQRLSVVSRTVALDEAALARALALARRAGFDVGRLVRVSHDVDDWRRPRPGRDR